MDTSNLEIRKIIAGVDPTNAMALRVGQQFGKLHITNIEQDERYFHKTNKQRYFVWCQNIDTQELFIWKIIQDLPVIIEHNCDF